jgi:hypothetical protein
VIWNENNINQQPDDISIIMKDEIPSGWVLIGASRVSANGNTVTGYGYDTDYNVLGWVASLPYSPVPLSNWALFLGIGLMLVVSVLIYRRRISG